MCNSMYDRCLAVCMSCPPHVSGKGIRDQLRFNLGSPVPRVVFSRRTLLTLFTSVHQTISFPHLSFPVNDLLYEVSTRSWLGAFCALVLSSSDKETRENVFP